MTVSDLTGTTWYFNDVPSFDGISGMLSGAIDFTTDVGSFSSFAVSTVGAIAYDGATFAYYSMLGGWQNPAYRTITVTGGTDATNADLIAWIEANATQVVKYPNKFVIDGVTKLDLTSDTALASDVAAGKYFHLATGERVQGGLANGNSIEYGITDGTLPLAGVAKAGYAVI